MPRQFYHDWAVVAEDEARHFEALARRLEEVGSRYGALPAHDGLWESAMATAHSLAARLAIEHCTHEARRASRVPCRALHVAGAPARCGEIVRVSSCAPARTGARPRRAPPDDQPLQSR